MKRLELIAVMAPKDNWEAACEAALHHQHDLLPYRNDLLRLMRSKFLPSAPAASLARFPHAAAPAPASAPVIAAPPPAAPPPRPNFFQPPPATHGTVPLSVQMPVLLPPASNTAIAVASSAEMLNPLAALAPAAAAAAPPPRPPTGSDDMLGLDFNSPT
jgi:hypothetical protein